MSDFIERYMPRLMPFSGTKDEFDKLVELSKQDAHGVLFPTDVVVQGGKTVGWWSIGVMPTAWAWMSTRDLKIRDSLQIINTVEGVQRRLGAPGMFMPCAKTSPFYGYLEKIGYTNGGNYDFFFKRF